MRMRLAVLASAAAVLAAIAAVTAVKYRQDIDAAFARVAQGSQVVDTRCGPIEYASTGKGPAVLLVHGAGGGFDQTLDAARELAARGFRVIAPSRFGYLRTPQRDDATPEAQADAHACLLDALKIRRAAAVGVSAGAPSAMQFALRYPRRTTALVLLVPLAYTPDRPAAFAPPSGGAWMLKSAVKSDFLYWLALRIRPALVQRAVLGTPPDLVAGANAEERARIDRFAWQPLPLSARQEGLLNDAAVASHLQRYDLERVATPTLVISASDDLWGTFDGARYTAQQIAGARFLALRDGGHLWVGHDREVMGEIVSFIATSAR
jgi:2-hydroxy-6-oxonona-2,4-dienedioate hydrolase